MKEDKTQIFDFFKKLTKVYDDSFIAKKIVENLCFFKQKKDGRSIFEWLNSMEKKRLEALRKVVKIIYIENNKNRRPFIVCGNFAIKFDEIIDIIKAKYKNNK